jgi:hypothetical protein
MSLGARVSQELTLFLSERLTPSENRFLNISNLSRSYQRALFIEPRLSALPSPSSYHHTEVAAALYRLFSSFLKSSRLLSNQCLALEVLTPTDDSNAGLAILYDPEAQPLNNLMATIRVFSRSRAKSLNELRIEELRTHRWKPQEGCAFVMEEFAFTSFRGAAANWAAAADKLINFAAARGSLALRILSFNPAEIRVTDPNWVETLINCVKDDDTADAASAFHDSIVEPDAANF